MSGFLFVAVTFAFGLAGLFPVRRALTPLGYSVAALPTGLLGWAIAASMANVLGNPLTAPIALLGATLSSLAITVVCRLVGHPDDVTAPFDWRPVAIWSAALLAVSGIAASSGVTALSWDSSLSYVPWGVWLADTGAFADIMLSSRSVLVPAMIAAERSLGGEWQSAIYVALGVNTLATLALAISTTPAATRRGRLIGTLTAVSLLAYATPFAFHTFYVHSHMVSAAFLLLALVSTERARHTAPSTWLLLAGISTAGLVLARPDGIAYALIPLVAATMTALHDDEGHGALIAFSSGFLGPTWIVIASALATLDLWEGEKLNGSMMVGLLVAYTVALGAYAALAGTRRRRRWARGGRWFLLGGTVAALVTTWILAPGQSALSYTNVVANLITHEGELGAAGYGTLWFFALGLAVLVLVAPRLRRDPELMRLLGWIALFLAIGLVVHAVTHPGRIGWNDSFARVVFHIVPVVMWLYGSVMARVVPEGRASSSSSAAQVGTTVEDA